MGRCHGPLSWAAPSPRPAPPTSSGLGEGRRRPAGRICPRCGLLATVPPPSYMQERSGDDPQSCNLRPAFPAPPGGPAGPKTVIAGVSHRRLNGLVRICCRRRDPTMAKIIGIDLGTTNSCIAVMGRRECQGDREFGRRPHDAFDGGVYRRRRAAGRPVRETPGGHQSREHDLRGQTPDRPAFRRSDDEEGCRTRALRDRQVRRRRRLGRRARRKIQPEPDQRLHPAEDEGNRGGLSGRAGRPGRHHRPGLFRRFPAPGDQGCRPDRRPRGQPHHQRADRGGPGLRAGEERERHHRGLRSGRRHLRRLDPRDRRRPVPGEVDQRRYLPGRRGFRRQDHRLSGRRVQKGPGHRPAQ